MNRRVSRRDFMKCIGAMAGAGVVSSCTPRIPAISPAPPPSQIPPVCVSPTPTPTPIPSPTPVSANFDVCSFYCDFRINGDPRCETGVETITPLYGDRQDPLTMKMDIKWARELGINTFVMPVFSSVDPRLEDWFLPASEPPFDINYAFLYNPDTDFDPKSKYRLDTQIRDMKEFFTRHTQHQRYKRLPDGRPLVFYFLADVVAYWLGVDRVEQTAQLLRSNLAEDIFLIGDVMCEPYYAQYDSSGNRGEDYIRRQVKAFDAITNYYIMRAGYKWNSATDFNHVVTPFQNMIQGYDEACAFWAARARKYGVKMLPAPMPTGFSNRLLHEAGLDSWLVDRHEGVSYDTSKAMAELGAKYADPDLKIVMISNWNELSEGAAIVPSVSYKFDPAHAVRDTFAIQPSGGWPEDYHPSS
jgi:hypothetical protein